MKKSNLRFLGLLGFLGFLGFFTNNYGFFGFYSFFSFWVFAGIQKDEMLSKNIAKAGLNAFVAFILAYPIAAIVLSILRTVDAAALIIGGIFAAQVLTFVISLMVYEKQGDLS
ncbi:MAG: DUF3796 domain-containing protein [Bacillota bacterium]